MQKSYTAENRFSNIDSINNIKQIDKYGYINIVRSMPEQLNEAIENYSINYRIKIVPKKVLILGVGTSVISGLIIQEFLRERINIPVIVSDSYYLPNIILKDTLILVMSYSGNTVEVINLLHQLLTRDLNLNIVVLSGGGNLENLTRENNLSFIKIKRLEPKKRTVLPYLAIPMLLTLNDIFSLGLNTDYFDKIIKEISLLRDEIDVSCKMEENIAKDMASKMFNKIPFIYTSKSSIYPVAVRWKFQLNENSKVFAFSNYLPNINHNEIMPWRYMNCASLGSFAVIFLRDIDDEVYISEGVNFTKKVIKKSKVKIFEIYLRGSNILEKIFKGVLIGDFVSYYLAILRNIDPSDVSEISRIKNVN